MCLIGFEIKRSIVEFFFSTHHQSLFYRAIMKLRYVDLIIALLVVTEINWCLGFYTNAKKASVAYLKFQSFKTPFFQNPAQDLEDRSQVFDLAKNKWYRKIQVSFSNTRKIVPTITTNTWLQNLCHLVMSPGVKSCEDRSLLKIDEITDEARKMAKTCADRWNKPADMDACVKRVMDQHSDRYYDVYNNYLTSCIDAVEEPVYPPFSFLPSDILHWLVAVENPQPK